MMNVVAPSLRRLTTAAPVLLVCLFLTAGVASSQTTSGKLVGQVLDSSGKPLSGAKVTVINENNGNARATVTDTTGQYIVPFLTPGSYSISATLDSFTGAGVKGFIIPLNSTTDLRPPDITLAPVVSPQTTSAQPQPSTQTTQPVNTEAKHVSMVNASDPTRRANFTERELELLPLGGATAMRSFDELALLAPGIAPPPYTPGVRGPGVGFGIGTAGQFSVNGARARSNNFTVDGSDNNDPDVGVRRQGFVALVPQSIESVQEIEISTLLWDAELGRNLGSQVNVVSKGGGNNYHGQAYGFLTDSRLNARNFFDYTGGPDGGKDPFTKVQSVFVFGGPVVKDKTQFFTSFERLEINSSSEQHFATPRAADRDFRPFVGQLTGSIPASFAVKHPFPGSDPSLIFGIDPRFGTTPLGNNVLSLYPLPNDPGGPYGGNTFSTILPSGGDGSVFSAKINHQ
ncbi:MAG: carboxypeptidase regulatory-like domain-containing protein, partial [Blastocatellia bacterium]